MNNQSVGGFPGIRWSQTASYGYVPNSALNKVFMAVAMDLGDPHSLTAVCIPETNKMLAWDLACRPETLCINRIRFTIVGHWPIVQQWCRLQDQQHSRFKLGLEVLQIKLSSVGRTDLRSVVAVPHKLTCSGWKEQLRPLLALAVPWWWSFLSVPLDSVKKWFAMHGGQMCAIYSGNLPSPPFVMDVKLQGM